MQGFEFEQYFSKFPHLMKHFIGVFAIDKIPRNLKYRQFCICNTDTSDGIGIHWFCFVRNSKKSVECFDSLGINESKKNVLKSQCQFKNISNIHFNETIFQSQNSDSCGYFTIYFILQRMHNLDIRFKLFLKYERNILKKITKPFIF